MRSIVAAFILALLAGHPLSAQSPHMTRATVERFSDAINRQDITAVAELLDDDTVFENTRRILAKLSYVKG